MGFIVEYNWVLKISQIEYPLIVGEKYNFEKNAIRIYPLNIPIDLLNKDWEAVGSCVITELSYHNNVTVGKFKVLEIYSGNKKNILTEYWKRYSEQNTI